MNEALKVKFWGVRGSHPVPGTGTLQFGGNTACVELRAAGRTLILDAGSGIIPLGRELIGRAAREPRALDLVILFSHLHHDHIQGFPFFAPAYAPAARLHLVGPGAGPANVRQVLETNQSAETFPVSLSEMPCSKDFYSARESQVILWDDSGLRQAEPGAEATDEALAIRVQRSYAHPGGVCIYRIGWRGRSIVYATDTEGYVGTDRRLAAFARGADLLIHDAQYGEEHYRGGLAGFPVTQGYGHSTAAMACELAASAQVRELVLFHHDPAYTDARIAAHEVAARRLFPRSRAAYEGLEIDLALDPAGSRERAARLAVQYAENG